MTRRVPRPTAARPVTIMVAATLAGALALQPAAPPVAAAATTAPAVSAPAGLATGSAVTVTGSGFTAGRTVAIAIGVTPAGSATVGSAGTFTTTLTVPSTLIAGPQPLAATESTSRRTATTTVSIRTDWPQSGGDAGHTGSNPAQLLLDASTASASVVKWSAATGIDYPAEPAVGAGLVIVAGSGVSARRTADGSQAWSAPGPADYPVISGTTLVLAGADLTMVGRDLTTGALRWQRDLRPDADDGYVSGVVVDGSRVFVGSASEVGGGAYSYAVTALDVATGARLWSTTLASQVRLAAAGGKVYAATVTGKLAALSGSGGNLLWVRQTAAAAFSAVTVAGGLVLGSTEVNESPDQYGEKPVGVIALDAGTGAPRWTWDQGSQEGIVSRVAVADGAVYLAANAGEFAYYLFGSFVSLDLQTGRQRWANTGVPQTGSDSLPASPVVGAGVMWSGSCGPSAKFLGFDASTGAKLRDLNPVRCADAVPVNSRVLVLDRSGVLSALGLPTEVGAVRTVDDGVTGSGAEKLTYAGSWVSGTSTGSYGGGQHASTAPGSTVTMPFSGTGVRYWFSVQPDGGAAEVRIDGSTVATIDQYAATRTNGLTSWTSPVLTRGSHTLTMVARAKTTAGSAGNRVALDRLEVAH